MSSKTCAAAKPVENRKSKTENRPVVFDIHSRLESCFHRMERILATLEKHTDPRIQLAAAAEMRKHVALAAQTLEIALRADALRDFQAAVLEALAAAGVRTRKKIMGLFEARAAAEQPTE